MMRICRHDSTLDITGKARTYEAIKARVLKEGRFSVFEATQNPGDGWRFEQLHRDPELEITRLEYPWIGVKLRERKK